jgi:oligoribonuclease (3'-5' exoribonuclease)
MIKVANIVEDGKLTCVVTMDKKVALHLMENILQQMNSWVADPLVLEAEEGADRFKVVVS